MVDDKSRNAIGLLFIAAAVVTAKALTAQPPVTTPPTPGNGVLYLGTIGLAADTSATYSVTDSEGTSVGSGVVPASLTLPSGTYTVIFTGVPGYLPSTSQTFTAVVVSMGSTDINATYTPLPPPVNKTMGLLVPFYVDDATDWSNLATLAVQYPTVPIIAVINPYNGPTTNPIAFYQSGIPMLQRAGIKVLGYSDTADGNKTQVLAENEVTTYKTQYPTLNGIMWDNFASASGQEAYYAGLRQFASNAGLPFIVGNAGDHSFAADYISSVDVMVAWENPGMPTTSYLAVPTSEGIPPSKLAFIAYGVTDLPTNLAEYAPYVSYLYVSDVSATASNTYGTVTSYLADLIGEIAAINLGTTYTPPVTGAVSTLTVNSVNSAGTGIQGYYTILYNPDGTINATGYTPVTFTGLSEGTTYSVNTQGYGICSFGSWSDGVIGNPRPITINSTTEILTAQMVC